MMRRSDSTQQNAKVSARVPSNPPKIRSPQASLAGHIIMLLGFPPPVLKQRLNFNIPPSKSHFLPASCARLTACCCQRTFSSVDSMSSGEHIQRRSEMAQRHQRGWLKKETRTQGEMWVLFFRTTRKADGKRVENKIPIGLVKRFPEKSDAWSEVERLHLYINKVDSRGRHEF